MEVSQAIAARRSVRGFLNKPVDIDLIRDIIQKAARAATGGNLQPWHIDIIHGNAMTAFKAIMAQKTANRESEPPEYQIYPQGLKSPYEARRFEVGEMLYESIGIAREDRKRRAIWFSRNFQFFGAPIGLFCTVDRQMGPPQWGDLGMMLQNVMLLSVEAGLDSCPQECWAVFPQTVRSFLGTPPERMLYAGMAIGYKDPADPANALLTNRASGDEWLTIKS